MNTFISSISKYSMGGGVFLLLIFACEGPASVVGGPPDRWASEAAPPVIYLGPTEDGLIRSFQSEVSVYHQDHRRPGTPRLVSQYKIAVKMIENRLYTRIDQTASPSTDGKARSWIHDGEILVYLDTATGNVLGKSRLSDYGMPQVTGLDLQNRSLFGRINLEDYRSEYARLGFALNEDPASGLLKVEIPGHLLPPGSTLPFGTVRNSRLWYDTAEQLPTGMEAELVTHEGETLQFTTQPIYAEKDGIPVKIGEVTTVKSDANDASVIPEDYPYLIKDETAIETVTLEELQALEAEGETIQYVDPVLQPAPDSPDSTFITTYDQIHLNNTPDSYFRVGF